MTDLPEGVKTRPQPPQPRPRSVFGTRCCVCRHAELFKLSAELAAGQSIRSVAKRYGLTHTMLAKHQRFHVGPALAMSNVAESVLMQIRRLHQRALAVLTRAEASDDLGAAIAAIRECRHNLELCGRLTGELGNPEPSEPTTVQVVYVDAQPRE
jgi:hypothetical protein